MAIDIESIPAELTQQRKWCVWCWEFRDGQWTKPPYQVDGNFAKSNDPTTWTSFNAVLQAVNHNGRYDGIGFMLNGDYTGVDWDDCIKPSGDIDPQALAEVEAINSYTEISPSGTGLKTLVRGKLPGKGHHEKFDDIEVGVFDSGRYFCVTGNVFPDVSVNIEARQPQIDALIRRRWPGDFKPKPTPTTAPGPTLDLNDSELIEKALNANDGGKFRRLWGGDTTGYTSPSEADMAICCKLAFYTRKDAVRIDSLFRQSGLMREKWDRDGYRELTITRAIEQTAEVYEPGRDHHQATDSRPCTITSQVEKEGLQLTSEQLFEAMGKGDDGDAELFTRFFKTRYCYDHAARRWYRFNGHHWEKDRTNEATSDVAKIIEPYAAEAFKQATLKHTAATDGREDAAKKHAEIEKALLKRISRLHTAYVKESILTLAAAGRDSLGITGESWDVDPWVIGCQNCVVDLRTGQARDGQPGDYIKTATKTVWAGLYAPCPTWGRFISEVFLEDDEMTDYIQVLFGYALIGDTPLHIIPILCGNGRNGKGTMLEAIKHVLGDYAYKAESEILLEQHNAKMPNAPNSSVLALQGKRLVWTSEVGEGRRFNAAKVKELVGGDTLSGRAVYGRDHIEFRPTHLLMLLTNYRPEANPNDYALWQRIHLIPFELAFVSNPVMKNERKADTSLPEKLKAEASGILAWMVRGCLKYQENGLVVPDKVKAAVDEYRNAEDVIGQFIEDTCIIDERTETQAGKMYIAYCEWCQSNGYKPSRANEFVMNMGTRFDSYKKRHRIYVGVALVSDDAENG
jgi:putative DNA primase/helicase